MSSSLILLGVVSGAAAGLLAGLLGIGGGIVVVPVIYYGLVVTGTSPDAAAHIAVGTSLAAIFPAALVSSFGHWRAGNTDVMFLRQWGLGIAFGVIAGQLAAPHLRGSMMTGLFSLLCLIFAARFAFPQRFQPVSTQQPDGRLRDIAGVAIGLCSALAGVGGGILTNIVMNLSGMPIHKSIGRAATVGIVVSAPATLLAALAPGPHATTQIGSIDMAMLGCIAPTQAAAAWLGSSLAQRISARRLGGIMAVMLLVTGAAMMYSTLSAQ